MDLAVEIINEQIRFYDFKVRDFHPHFGATQESTNKRLKELQDTLSQLKRVKEIILSESSGLNKPVVINRRELLLEYTKWLSNQDLSKHVITLVDEYEQASNSL